MELQDKKSEVPIRLSRVGVTNVRKQIYRKRGERENFLNTEIEAYVDLDPRQTGIHMSRSTEVINGVIEEVAAGEITDTEDMCSEIVTKLFEVHPNATKAEVRLKADYPIIRETPRLKTKTQVLCKLLAGAKAEKTNEKTKLRRMIGVEVQGMTACPCAQDSIKSGVKENMKKLGLSEEKIERILEKVPIASHSQRGMGTLVVNLPLGYRIEADDLIKIVEDSMSEQLYEVLKREDEAEVIARAYLKPRFVEETVRAMIAGLLKRYPDLPSDAYVIAKQLNLESIHQHDAFAEWKGQVLDLKKELEANS
jgi:GTP cyclohydrolase-4